MGVICRTTFNHLAPIYLALPDDIRGKFYAQGAAHTEAVRLGIPDPIANQPRRTEGPVVVASYEDYHRVRPCSVVLVGHGVGQTYNGDPSDNVAYRHKSYSGGRNRERVVLNICCSERDAAINREFYPNVPSVAVGVPKLDHFHAPGRRGIHWPEPKHVVISFHMDATVCPETRWAFPHYKKALTELAAKQDDLPYKLVGHWHPRAQWHLQQFWQHIGVQTVENFDDVLDSAALYVIDNSSSAYEFASTDRPVLTLNSPTYRRSVNHGLRFWSEIPGLSIDGPEQLEEGISEALLDPPKSQYLRTEALRVAYGDHDGRLLTDGRATERAVEALMALVGANVGR